MPAFYPSMVVEFTSLMFDETLHVSPDPELQAIGDTAMKTLSEVLDIPSGPLDEAGSPLVLRRGDSKYSFIGARVPKSGSIELAGYRQASSFRFTFDFVELPIDPRTVRQCAVSVFLGAVAGGDFAEGMAKPNLRRQSLVRTRTAGGEVNQDALRMTGMVDEWEVAHTENGSEVTVSGRDLRGLMLDVSLDQKPGMQDQILDSLPMDRPIDEVVRALCDVAKIWKDVEVKTDPDEWLGGVPSPGRADAVPRHRKGAKGDRAGGRANPPGTGSGGGKLSFWDLIVRLCFMVGAVPYFRGNVLVIRPVKGLYRQVASGGLYDPTPFSGGKPRSVIAASKDAVPDGPLTVRRMVYGRDLESITFDRKLGGVQRPRGVRVVSVDGSSKSRGVDRLLEARWPREEEKKARSTKPLPNAKDSMEELVNVPVSGITDKAQLEEVARAVYEEIGRGEIGGTCVTKNLASFGGDNADPDLLRLKPGDAVEFQFDAKSIRSVPPMASSVVDFHGLSFDTVVEQVKRSVGDEDLARVLVATARGQVAELQRFFRVGHVAYDWGEDGVKITFGFQNFVEARSAVGKKVGKDKPDFSFTEKKVYGR